MSSVRSLWRRFSRSAWSCVCLVFVANSHFLLADDATLMWSNGDALQGELLGADEAAIVWKSPLFNDPLKVRLPAISSVTFPAAKESDASPDLYRILTQNGDVLFGKLKSADEQTLTFEGPRFGTFQISRTGILGIQKSAGGGGILYSGPRGMEGWQPAFRRTVEEQNQNGQPAIFGIQLGFGGAAAAPVKEEKPAQSKVGPWTALPDGSIKTTRPDAALFLQQKLPEKYEVEFELYSKKGMSFVLSMGRDTKNGLRIESWINVLVAARGTKFTSLMELKDSEQTLHLHSFVDNKSKKMIVFSHAGDRLGEIGLAGLRGLDGITLRNGDGELTLKKLMIRGWDGQEPRISGGSGTQIQLADGTVKSGTFKSFNAESRMLTVDENSKDVELSEEQLASVSFAADPAAPKLERGASQLIWNDGGYVSGVLKSIANGEAVIATPYAPEPLHCRLENASRLALTPGQLEEVQTDRLFHAGKSLQGSLVVDGEADRPIQWKPLGGLSASTLRDGGSARFVRGSQVQHFSEQPDTFKNFPDVLYLKNNDVIPCKFESMTDTEVVLTSPFSDIRSFPKDKIRAIELGATGRIHHRGFSDAGWKGIPAKEKDREKLSFRGNNRYSHPAILTGDTIRFRLKWPLQSYSSLTMSMYGTGTAKDTSSTHICFTIMQAMLQITDAAPNPNNNQFMFRGFGGQNPNEMIRAPKGEADVQIVARDGNLLISIDGKQVKTIKLNPAGAGLKGFAINANVQSLGNVVVNGRVQQSGSDCVEISQFEIDNLSGASVRQFIQEEVRQMALTVPRFRRESPPTHVLVAANGDLLRGRLSSISETDIQFESRLENVRIERSRIAAIVWLDPPPKEAAAKLTRPKKGTDLTNAVQPEMDVVKVQAPGGADVLMVTGKLPALDANGQPITAPAEQAQPENDQDAFVINDESSSVAGTMQASLADGFSLTMIPVRLENGQIKATSELLGNCTFPAATIRELSIGNPADREVTSAYEQWIARNAPEPDWDVPAADGGNSAGAQMIGKPAEDFELSLLDGTKFRLKDHADKIVVLDFWATWCGPCVAALPDYIAATGHFDSSKVIFVAVNQQEAPDQIRRFLDEKQMAPIVALDRDGAIGQKFQVSGIPHTVIIGPGGIVEDVHVGYQAGAGEHLQMSIQQMLDGTWKRPDPNAPKEEPQDPAKEPDGV